MEAEAIGVEAEAVEEIAVSTSLVERVRAEKIDLDDFVNEFDSRHDNRRIKLHSVDNVADTFWSVHVKCCFHQKKTKSKRPTTNIKSAERQRKGRHQSSTKNVTSKTSRLHKVAKQHKASNRSVGNLKTSCMQTKSNAF